MYYQAISFNYKNCSLENREILGFKSDDEKKAFLNKMVAFDFIHEVFIISTCNRIEIVTANKNNFATYHTLLGTMSEHSGINFHQLKDMMKSYDDKEAVRHIFSVISSLDSLVVGESQITGQVKDAFKFSYENKTAGKKLNRLVSYGVKCAAQIRKDTQISANPISIASVAVSQASEVLQDTIAGMTAIVVGTGEMGILATKHLIRIGCDVVLLSRDTEKAKLIASEISENVKVAQIEQLEKYMNRYRLLFTATASPSTIITKEMIEECDFHRLWFDMAIPRDIEDIVDDKIMIYRIDDLQKISNSNHALREEQALVATELVDRYEEDFFKWLQALSIEPVIKGLREQAKEAICSELDRAISKGFVSSENRDNMKKMATQMFNKFLHNSTQKMRQSTKDKDGASIIEAIQSIFEINTDNIDPKQYKNEHHTKGYES